MSGVVELLRSWSHPRAIVVTVIAIGAAGCSSESVRFSDNPFSSQSAPSEVTGSVPARTAPVGRVETSALPPPAASRPVTTAAAPGVAGGGRGLSTYQPSTPAGQEVTGSVAAPPPAAHPPAPRTQWSWDGGTAVTVAKGETVDSIAHRHGVPRGAILQANNLSAGQAIYPGQRLVIPRYNQAAAPAQPALRPTIAAAAHPAPQAPANNGLGVHIVAPGDTLIKISRMYKKPLVEIAKANKIQPQATLHIGEKIIIPGLRAAGVQHKETTQVAEAKPAVGAAPRAPAVVSAAVPQPKTPAGKPIKQAAVSSEPAQSAAVVTPANETPTATTGAVKSAAGMPPSFRWPVKARVIAGFGPRPNGQQNDGINLAVPEGTSVKAAEDGVVAYAGSELKGYGNLVLVRHANGYVTAYAHAKELMVKRGDPIKRGQVIAKSGQTGNVDAPQLHFEIRKGPAPMDPLPMLSGG